MIHQLFSILIIQMSLQYITILLWTIIIALLYSFIKIYTTYTKRIVGVFFQIFLPSYEIKKIVGMNHYIFVHCSCVMCQCEFCMQIVEYPAPTPRLTYLMTCMIHIIMTNGDCVNTREIPTRFVLCFGHILGTIEVTTIY